MIRAAGAFAAALLLAGCGDGKPAGEADPAAAIVVTIGHAGPLTGSIAHQGKDDENGVALAIDQANAAGVRIGGRPVTFRMMSEDDQGDPKIGTLVAQKFVDARVPVVIGHLNSGVSIPASEIYARAGIPMITGSATAPELTERGLANVYRVVGRDDQQGPAIAAYIAGPMGAKRVAIVDDKTAYGEGLANEVEKSLRAAGVAIVGRERVSDKETDFKAVLTRIKQKKVDAIFHGGMDATGGPMMRQARELGLVVPFAFGDGACTEEMEKLTGRAGEGLACSQAGIPTSAASPAFLAAFNAKYGPTKAYAPFFYDATRIAIEAMKRADSVDPARFGPRIREVTLAGATGPIAFDAKGDRKDAEMTILSMRSGTIEPVAIYRDGRLSAMPATPAR